VRKHNKAIVIAPFSPKPLTNERGLVTRAIHTLRLVMTTNYSLPVAWKVAA